MNELCRSAFDHLPERGARLHEHVDVYVVLQERGAFGYLVVIPAFPAKQVLVVPGDDDQVDIGFLPHPVGGEAAEENRRQHVPVFPRLAYKGSEGRLEFPLNGRGRGFHRGILRNRHPKG